MSARLLLNTAETLALSGLDGEQRDELRRQIADPIAAEAEKQTRTLTMLAEIGDIG